MLSASSISHCPGAAVPSLPPNQRERRRRVRPRAAEWTRENLSDLPVQPPQVSSGEVAIQF